jgi:hypothetical protein
MSKTNIVEIKSRKEDLTKVDFFINGLKIENINATRVFNNNGIITAEAVIIFDSNFKDVKKTKGEADDI